MLGRMRMKGDQAGRTVTHDSSRTIRCQAIPAPSLRSPAAIRAYVEIDTARDRVATGYALIAMAVAP